MADAMAGCELERLKLTGGWSMFRRRLLAASLAACGALLIGACGSSSSAGGGVIKVGITGPFTGAYADPGTAIRNAGELAIADINAAGGINGRMLQGVPEDDACDAQQGTQAAEKLLTQGIIAIVGGYCSGASIPESDILHRTGDLPFITAASSNPKFTEQGYDNVFRMVSRDDAEAPADVSFMKDWLKASKIAILHDNTTYAKGLADSAKTAAAASGVTVTYFDAITPGQKDYSSALTRVGTTHPDVLFYTGYYPEFGLLAKEYVSLAPSFKLNGVSADVDPSVIKVAGTALNNPGITINTLPTTEFIHNTQNDTFTQKYQQKYGRAPGDYSSYEYDGMTALAQALKDDGGKTDAKSLNAALHAVSISSGTTGSIKFDSKGDRPTPLFLAVHASGNPPTFSPIAIRQNGAWVASS
ncbi:MAG: branched-chain amino acid ABC transporter substrate-binding protein [Chloroflexi bacterium]|nr:MAG: branched-chain amino acid ABC transporter substrate-binding protein [Chloroflexota bacterium]TME94696.1 MAG: branched-chain amino acid ABC transporter substrate-binding protein [Chloroflexota bacterium]